VQTTAVHDQVLTALEGLPVVVHGVELAQVHPEELIGLLVAVS